jgi:hypothetical protein
VQIDEGQQFVARIGVDRSGTPLRSSPQFGRTVSKARFSRVTSSSTARLHRVMGHLQRRVRHQIGMTDRDAVRYGQKPCNVKVTSLAFAELVFNQGHQCVHRGIASPPSVSIVIVLPLPAASIITPMMLLALMRRPLRSSHTSHGGGWRVCVSLADARACRPSLLTI